ncbi:YpmS family protein [Leuconostocaceae bacterium ESL0958]|nr:YpmS family protein [Leuconostocaceae bacterium ESL0958]
MKKRSGFWFYLFWLLILALLAGGAYTAYLAYTPTRTNFSTVKQSDSSSSFDVSLDRDQVNDLLKTYFSEQDHNRYDVHVQQDNLEMATTVKILGQSMDAKITAEPKLADNGNVVLAVKEVSLGKMNLPTNVALGYIAKMYDGPKGVSFQPDQQQIALDMHKLTQKGQLSFTAKELNMKDGHFVFTGMVDHD